MKPIKSLQLTRDYKASTAALKRQHAAPSHADQTIDQDTVVIAPNGRIIAVFLKQVIEPALYKRAYKSWKIVNELPDKRATAVGSLSLRRINKNGTLGDYNAVPKRVLKILKKQCVRHGTLGYLDATPDKSFHRTPLTKKHPKMLHRNKTLIELVDKLYKKYLRKPYATQRAAVKKARRFRLWHTAFSTIYLAKNFRTAYHTDSGNLLGVMTALMTMGHFTGGELVLPRWRIAFALRPGDLLLFDPQQLHGNLPFEGKRLSAAYFCARRIAKCGK
jgi:Oxygenase domain of the 2OGFeDO superfamily